MSEEPSDYLPAQEANRRSKPRIFKVQQKQLIDCFSDDFSMGQRLMNLAKLGGTTGIMQGIVSDTSTGVVGDKADLLRRQAVYGPNTKPLPPPSSIVDSFKQEAKNIMWVAIGVTAVISGVCGIYMSSGNSLVEAISIIFIGLVLILISSLTDYLKDKKLVQLQELIQEESVTVIRGKIGATERVSIWSIVVGDVINITEGQKIPADCLVIESVDLEVDEDYASRMAVNNEEQDGQQQIKQNLKFEGKRKSPYDAEHESSYNDNLSPFIKADSLVTRGQGKLLVCCTGENSTRGVNQASIDDLNESTRLQAKLKNLANQFTKIGIFCGLAVLIILVIMTVVCSVETEASVTGIIIGKLAANINLTIVLVVVAIPEGLPLTIQIAIAFSVIRMHRDWNIIVRKQAALENIAEVEELIVGKTSVLTQNKMKVKRFFCELSAFDNNRKDTFFNCQLSENTLKLVQEGILYNNQAYVEMGGTKYVPVGDGTEVGFLKFLQAADIPIHHRIKGRFDRVVASKPKSSEAGRQFSACAVDEGDEFINVHIKGAPEAVLALCGSICGPGGSEPFPVRAEEGNLRQKVEDCVDEMGQARLRVIAFAHAAMSKQAWQDQLAENPGASANEVLAQILAGGAQEWLDIVLVGAFGLQDRARPQVASAIKHCGTAGMTVRMISGDSKKTAEAVALEVGLIDEPLTQEAENALSPVEQREYQEKRRYSVMEAADFDAEVGGDLEKPGPAAKFAMIMKHLRVLARAQPAHKLRILKGLQAPEGMARKVAVTGGSIADVDAIHHADVGLAMGSGCSAAKNVSDMILTADDFEATLRAVMWGRNIYHNVSRFLQFQITVNISAVLVVACGSFYFGESPLSAVQLLWINVIMDTMAAFALGTEPPEKSVVAGQPYRDQVVLPAAVWRQILGLSLWNFVVIMCVIFFAPAVGGLKPYTWDTAAAEAGPDSPGKAKLRHMTYVFTIFVFLQLFNQINCRKDGVKEYNVFAQLGHNWYFLGVVLGEFAVQFICTGLTPGMTRTCALTREEWGACLMLGSTALLASPLLKCTPRRWVEKFNVGLVDEARVVDEGGMLGQFNRINAMQVGGAAADTDNDYKAGGTEDAAGGKTA